jgi:hypothetical protein
MTDANNSLRLYPILCSFSLPSGDLSSNTLVFYYSCLTGISSTGPSIKGKALHFLGKSPQWRGLGWLRNFRTGLISSCYEFIIAI